MSESTIDRSGGPSFVGRKAELETARRALAEARLLTVIGPTGVGKTRFARKLADQMVRAFPEPASAIDLHADEPVEALGGELRDRAGILILDGADGRVGVRELVERLMADNPKAAIIATSTTTIRAPGEHLLELRPFVVPPRAQSSSRAILEFDAVRLLIDRIRMVDPAFAAAPQDLPVLRDIVEAADGVPAVLELAGAATRFVALEGVSEALRAPDSMLDLLPAADRLRADAERDLTACDQRELRLLTTASALREPVGLDCLVSLAADEDAPVAALVAAFSRLVDRSVLVSDAEADRAFRVLRPLRRAARLRLDADGGFDRVVARTDQHLIELMNRLADAPPGPAEVLISRHLHGHRPSLERFFARYAGDPATAGDSIRLIVRLRTRWSAYGLADQVQAWLAEAVKCRDRQDDLTAEALRTQAYFSVIVRDVERSAALIAESLRFAAPSADSEALPTEFIQALVRLGELDLEGAESLLEDIVERTLSSGRFETLGEQVFYLSFVNVIRGNHARAEQHIRTGLELLHAVGNRWSIAYLTIVRAISLLHRGLHESAGESAREALAMMDSLGNSAGVSISLHLLATVAHRCGDPAKSAMLLAAAARMAGARTMTWDAIDAGLEPALRQSLGSRDFSRFSMRGRQLERGALLALALGVDGPARATRPAELTRRESEIAELVVEGLSNAEIAARLVLSTRTVEGHVQRMLNKLQFRSRSQIAVWFRERLDTGVRSGVAGSGTWAA